MRNLACLIEIAFCQKKNYVCFYLVKGACRYCGATDQNIVAILFQKWKLRAKNFFQTPSRLVANDGVADLFAYNKPTSQVEFGRRINKYKPTSRHTCALAIKIVESFAACQSVLLLHVLHQLSSKLLSASVAASFDNISASRRTHSLTEAVNLAACSLFWLISLFHFCILSFSVSIFS